MEDEKVAELLQGLGKTVKEMVDTEIAALREEMQLGFDELVGLCRELDMRVQLGLAVSGADYRAFLVDEARRMGVRPSEMVKKEAGNDE